MYIVKNALRCISRAKGRNILIGIIVLVIAVSACLGLSIRQAAENAREETMEGLSVTATISYDRSGAIKDMKPDDSGEISKGGEISEETGGGKGGGFDRSQFAEMMGNASSLTLEEYEAYAKASTVKDFYYSASLSVNGSDNLEPVSSDDTADDTDEESSGSENGMFGGKGGMGGMSFMMGSDSDFTVIGYSGENAMTDFTEGIITISSENGQVFDEGTEEYQCIISEELAAYNNLSVGDTIDITNPNNEEEAYTLTVTGLYTDSSANENSFSRMGITSTDPANKIYMSYNALSKIVDASAEISTTETDEDTGREFETGLTETLNATYTFADVDDYETFAEEVYELGLDESYTVSSSDITAFETSLTPLTTLSKTAGYFLIVILAIGAVILIVLNIFNVRERKYEIGVLTAMGMKKSKVAMQFITEIFVVTLAAVIVGAVIGSVTAVPVTNALLQTQTQSTENRAENIEQNFGRGGNMESGEVPEMPSGSEGNMFSKAFGGAQDYITEINSATDFTVILQMLLIAVALTLIAGAASMLFIMRYEPLRILSNRD